MTPDEIDAARVKNAESMSASRKHKRFVDLLIRHEIFKRNWEERV